MSDAATVSAVMREMSARRWRGRVPARLARELVPRVDELPRIERRQLLDALTQAGACAELGGAAIRLPLADMFWGDRHGQMEDPFGHRWNIAQHLRNVPHDEVIAAAAQAFS